MYDTTGMIGFESGPVDSPWLSGPGRGPTPDSCGKS